MLYDFILRNSHDTQIFANMDFDGDM